MGDLPGGDVGESGGRGEGRLNGGWYPDPTDSTRRLYWDGRRWTGDVSTGSVPAPTVGGAPSAMMAAPSRRHRTTFAWAVVGTVVVVGIALVLISTEREGKTRFNRV